MSQVGNVASGQTDRWIDKLHQPPGFIPGLITFIAVYSPGRSEQDPSRFGKRAGSLHYAPNSILFIDNMKANSDWSRERGGLLLHIIDKKYFRTENRKTAIFNCIQSLITKTTSSSRWS